MPEAVSFFTPVSYGNLYTSKFEKLLGFTDDCFFFGGHKAVVMERSSLERSQRVELKSVQVAMWKTAFKVVVWLACFAGTVWNPMVWCVPAGLLGLKVVCRMMQPFHVETDPETQQLKVKICAPKDFRHLRNQERGSDLSILPRAENGVTAASIPVHSFLLPEFFANRASSHIGLGLDEKEGIKKLDLRDQPSATTKNIHRLLDYYYTGKIEDKLTLDELLGLFDLSNYVLAHDLKKQILELLQQMPEARKDPRFIPVIRDLLLSPMLDDVEASLLFEWFFRSYRRADRAPFIDEYVRKEAGKKEARALVFLNSCAPDDQRIQYLSAFKEREANPIVQQEFGIMLVQGRCGFPKDVRKGLALIQQAAESGLPTAKGFLAYAYLHGEYGVNKDLPKALKLAEESALAGCSTGMNQLFVICRGSQNFPRDGVKAFEAVSLSAKKGSAFGKLLLAESYRMGIGVQTDRVRARDLYQQWLEMPRESGEEENIDYVRHWIQQLAQ